MLWLEGRITAGTTAAFDLADRGLLLADGLFETLLVVGGTPFRLEEHLARMARGADTLRLPLDLGMVRRSVLDLAASAQDPVVVRVTATRGPGARGLAIPAEARPAVFATSAPWSPALAFGRQSLATAGIRRNETSPLSGIKSLAYLDNVLAHEAARAAGADDALMLSGRGTLACTAMANLFVVRGDELATPRLSDGVLPGTLRALLIDVARDLGLSPVERSIPPAELDRADAMIATNSVRLITRVTALDARPLRQNEAAVGQLIAAVRQAVADECGTALPA